MDLDLVTVYRARNELMANTIRDLLLQDGIGATLRAFRIMNDPGENLRTNVYGNSFGAWGEVLVLRNQADEAIELIQGFLDESAELLGDEELEALALAAGSTEVDPELALSAVEVDRKSTLRGSRPAWLTRTFRTLFILVAGPPENHYR